VNLFGLAKLAAMRTLSNRSALLLDLEEGTVCVLASGRAVTFDAGVTGVLFSFDDDHCVK
jgi:hypothetical protein